MSNSQTMPAVSLVAVPGRISKMLEAARKFEDQGFTGIYCPSLGDCLGLCQAIAQTTNEIAIGTSIMPIYFRHPVDLARTAAFIHELSNGRFRLGLGVSHGPVYNRFKLSVGKPLADMRGYVADVRAAEKEVGPAKKQSDFFIGDMIPTVIDDD